MIVQQQLLHFKMALVSPFFENGILRFLYLSPYIYIGIGLLAIWIMLKYWQAILLSRLTD